MSRTYYGGRNSAAVLQGIDVIHHVALPRPEVLPVGGPSVRARLMTAWVCAEDCADGRRRARHERYPPTVIRAARSSHRHPISIRGLPEGPQAVWR